MIYKVKKSRINEVVTITKKFRIQRGKINKKQSSITHFYCSKLV